jgi:hypothetical protein
MLTPDQIAALRDRVEKIAEPIREFLLEDIARRISEAGQLTSTASYQIWQAQQLGASQQYIKKRLKDILEVSGSEIEQLLTQSAEVGYRFDLSLHPTAEAIPFAENTVLQQIVSAAVELAQEDFTNLTQTLGMIDPYGNPMPLQDVYRSCTDFAFKQVITGATDYNTAIRRATKNLADQGVLVIDYESGRTTTLEAAVRRNIMGGLGLMQEKISQQNHDDFGCDGWEISAHANSAPDHEPIQGKQYSDAEYINLNNSLVRRIGTLNCGHAAFPIILGVDIPQYTPEELEKFRQDNAEGVTVDGKHYTGYEATQMQRKIERAMRREKRRILTAEATEDTESLPVAQTRLQRLRQEYTRFSDAAGLRTQDERAQVAGFGHKEAARARKAAADIEKAANSMYDIGDTEKNVNAWLRDQPIRRDIIEGKKYPPEIFAGRQQKHVSGTAEFLRYAEEYKKNKQFGPSRVTISQEDMQKLVYQYRGTGILLRDKNGRWTSCEVITVHPDIIGIAVNNQTGEEAETMVFKIHYSKDGVHIVPDYPSKKGAKARK